MQAKEKYHNSDLVLSLNASKEKKNLYTAQNNDVSLQELSAGTSQVRGGEQLSAEFIRQLECFTRKTQQYYCEILIKYSDCTTIMRLIILISVLW